MQVILFRQAIVNFLLFLHIYIRSLKVTHQLQNKPFPGRHLHQVKERQADIRYHGVCKSSDRHRLGVRAVESRHHRRAVLRSQASVTTQT